MKKLFTLLFTVSCLSLFAQVNPGLKVTINGKSVNNISASFGGELTPDVPLCGELVHVKGTGTSTANPPMPVEEGCNSLTNANDLKGKIALIRRGSCEFGDKCLRAEEAGAIAVLVYNRVDPDNANEPINMGTGAVGANVTIPCAMISLDDGLAAYDILKSGGKVNVCFTVPSKQINEVYANPWGNMYPQNQLDTIFPTVSYTNNSDSISGVITKVDIVSPSGIKTTLSRTHDMAVTEPGFVNIIPVSGYYPSEKGIYKATFYNTFISDTVTSQFIVSDYTFGNDLNQALPKGVTRDKTTFVATDLKISNILNFYVTGNDDTKATYATFGLRNAAAFKNRDINISVLETSPDRIDAITGTTLSPGDIGDIVGDIVTYTVSGNEDPNQLITIPLKDGSKKGIDLTKNTAYVLVFEYDGSSIKNDSVGPQWTLGRTTPSRWPGISMFGTALMTGARYYSGGWGDTEDPIGRLHIDGFTIGTKNLATLDNSEVGFFPNPTADVVNVKLALKETAKTVELGIMDFFGRVISTYTLDVQNGIVPVNISNYPAGTYFFTVKTNKAFTTEKIIKR